MSDWNYVVALDSVFCWDGYHIWIDPSGECVVTDSASKPTDEECVYRRADPTVPKMLRHAMVRECWWSPTEEQAERDASYPRAVVPLLKEGTTRPRGYAREIGYLVVDDWYRGVAMRHKANGRQCGEPYICEDGRPDRQLYTQKSLGEWIQYGYGSLWELRYWRKLMELMLADGWWDRE